MMIIMTKRRSELFDDLAVAEQELGKNAWQKAGIVTVGYVGFIATITGGFGLVEDTLALAAETMNSGDPDIFLHILIFLSGLALGSWSIPRGREASERIHEGRKEILYIQDQLDKGE
jgi:hypothetical protein